MIDVIIVGEDAVTRAVIRRLLNEICPEGIHVIREDPARGGEIRGKTPNYNRLAQFTRVIMLADLDTAQCPATEIRNWLGPEEKHPHFLLRFAVDEAESWLLADRTGLASYLGVSEALMPEPSPQNIRETHNVEIRPRVKSSLFLMMELVPHSSRTDIRRMLTPKDRFSKGPEYNSALVPFIENDWNVNEAGKNSYSLRRMMDRIREWCDESFSHT